MVHYAFDKALEVKPKKGYVNEKKRDKDERKNKFCSNKFVEFCKRTDLHGYKYIVMEDLNTFERSCWALAVIMSIAIAAFFVIKAYNWYARNPIVTVIESTQGAIWDIPFPAVTICNLNAVSRRAARRFSYNLTLPANVSAEEIFRSIRLAPMLHSTYITEPEQKIELMKLQNALDLNDISVEALFRYVSPASSCNDLVQKCMWKYTILRCEQLFQQVFVQLNLCCTFNYYAVELTKEAARDFISTRTPRRVASCGYRTALTVLIKTDPEDYYSASVASHGAFVIIDNSYNVPNMDSSVRLVNPNTEVLIALSPERTYATAGIKSFSPDQRQCYYNNEVKIGKLRQYSFHNCMAYLRADMIKNSCNCLPFYFPSDDDYRSCNFGDLECLENVLKMSEEYADYESKQAQQTFKCLPECEHYDYPLEVALGKIAMDVQLHRIPFFNDVNLVNQSLLNMFFNDLVSTRYRRDVYLNWQNILASFGGLLSLMLGFTLISGFDVILFFTFRMVYDLYTATVEKKKKLNNQQKINVVDIQRNGWTDDTLLKKILEKNQLRKLENSRNRRY